jgi:hypothetical protein
MTAESILERISQNPFWPIVVKTIGGTRIEINQAEDIFIYDRIKTTCVVLFDSAARKFIYAPEQITAIEAGNGTCLKLPSQKDLLKESREADTKMLTERQRRFSSVLSDQRLFGSSWPTSSLADDFLGFVAMPLRKTLTGN